MKKLLTKIAVCITAAVTFAAGVCTGGETLVAHADPFENNTLIVGFDAEFPPYGYKDDESGEYVGFDLDLAQEVCNRKGWTLKKQPIEWNSKDMELRTGSIDCIWNGFTINGKEDKYTWSTPYVDNSQVVVVRSDDNITKLSDLKGKIVAVQSDSSALAALTDDDADEENKLLAESFADLQQVSDYNSAFMNLESGAVDAICLDIGVANYELESRGNKFTMLDELLATEKYGIGFKLGNTELRNEVQEVLLDMLADGTFDEIAEKWGLEESVCLSADDTFTTDTDSSSATESFGEKILDISKQLAGGLAASLAIFLLTLLFSMPLGLLIMAGRMSRFAPLRGIVKLYISIVRGTPLMLQLLVVFFGPFFLFNISTTANYRFVAVIIGFTLNYAAYFAEIYRSGIQAIPKGQYEACKVLGYSRMQTNIKIVFPQMIKNIIPSITNEVITLVKDTSLAFAVSYTEMFTLAKQIAAAQATIMPLFIAGIFYYIFNFVVAFIMEKIENKLNFFR
jgi:polar amino acid transport system substrate-binding protein